jgi:hypothetical protein
MPTDLFSMAFAPLYAAQMLWLWCCVLRFIYAPSEAVIVLREDLQRSSCCFGI